MGVGSRVPRRIGPTLGAEAPHRRASGRPSSPRVHPGGGGSVPGLDRRLFFFCSSLQGKTTATAVRAVDCVDNPRFGCSPPSRRCGRTRGRTRGQLGAPGENSRGAPFGPQEGRVVPGFIPGCGRGCTRVLHRVIVVWISPDGAFCRGCGQLVAAGAPGCTCGGPCRRPAGTTLRAWTRGISRSRPGDVARNRFRRGPRPGDGPVAGVRRAPHPGAAGAPPTGPAVPGCGPGAPPGAAAVPRVRRVAERRVAGRRTRAPGRRTRPTRTWNSRSLSVGLARPGRTTRGGWTYDSRVWRTPAAVVRATGVRVGQTFAGSQGVRRARCLMRDVSSCTCS
ncbi:hypothetical protein J2S66_005786 [Saccharothrix longispora]|uniref:Uncharacterized protein n=1 Tax=Saccharothrix longispora TaxID=33920 RepID=A0ABU1Q3B9_9PSEU|nr:hypothetical protein [Saccharothrix longispora]